MGYFLKRAYSFIEILLSIIIIILILGIVLNNIRSTKRKELEIIGEKIKSDLELARILAISNNINARVYFKRFDPSFPNSLYPYDSNANNFYFIKLTGEVYCDNITGQKYYFNLNRENSNPYAKIWFDNTDTLEIVFNTLGYLTEDSSTEIFLYQSGKDTVEIKVNPVTGLID